MLRKIAITLFAFLILYYPPIFSIQGTRAVAIIAWVLLIVNVRGISKTLNTIETLKIIAGGLFTVFYIIVVGIINNNEYVPTIAGMIYLLIAFLPAGIVLACFTKSMNFDIYDFILVLLNAAMLQSILAISAMLVPSVKSSFISWMVRGHVFQEGTYSYALILRIFGYSTGLTYGMPIVQAYLAFLALYLAFEKNSKYLIYVPFLTISAFINSRTTAIVAVACLLVLIVLRRKTISLKALLRGAVIIVGVVLVVTLLPQIVETFSPETYKWVQTGYGEIFRFTQGDTSSGYFNYLVDPTRWRLPKGITLLFGTGIRVMSGVNKYGLQSDIGYVNDLWMGGIFLTSAIYVFWTKRIIRLKRLASGRSENEQGLVRYIWLTMLITYYVINIKGYAFDLNNFTVLFILLFSYMALTKNKDYFGVEIQNTQRRIRFVLGGKS